jgi:hypothetical protein
MLRVSDVPVYIDDTLIPEGIRVSDVPVYIDGTLIPEGAHVNIIKSDYVFMKFPYRFIKEDDDGKIMDDKIMDGKLMKNVGVDYDPEGRGAIVTYKVHLDTDVDIVFKSNEYYFVVTHKPVLIKNPPMRGSGRRKRSRKTKRRQSKRRSRK